MEVESNELTLVCSSLVANTVSSDWYGYGLRDRVGYQGTQQLVGLPTRRRMSRLMPTLSEAISCEGRAFPSVLQPIQVVTRDKTGLPER